MNRAVFEFNDVTDRAVLKPIAEGYVAVTPAFARTGISNFFGNLQDVVSFANDLLQGKPAHAADDFSRVAMNSVFGIFGLFDLATPAGIEKHDEDFGQTLGVWGVPAGPYLVLPFFGPSTVRDGAALPVDIYTHPIAQIEHVPERNSASALRLINTRAGLLGTEKLVEQAALDKYVFIRGAYLRRRQNQVYDGKPPEEPEE
jgi:phospholipid-binding lipoprotein MlaA